MIQVTKRGARATMSAGLLIALAALSAASALTGCNSSQAAKEKRIAENFNGKPMPPDVQKRMNDYFAKQGEAQAQKAREEGMKQAGQAPASAK